MVQKMTPTAASRKREAGAGGRETSETVSQKIFDDGGRQGSFLLFQLRF
jgi:hypothetical protein